MARRLKEGILQTICKYVEETEVPTIFGLWSGISAISAVLGRNCFIDQGHFTVFPNTYVVLVAGSARCRKSTAIKVCSDLLAEMQNQPRILSQKQTCEALIGTLSGFDADEDETEIIKTATGIAVVDELSTLIDKHSFTNGLISLLTNLYDCGDFEYKTRGRGSEFVRNPCMSILGGSTLHWIKEAIPIVSIGGGFTSRIVFIFQESRDRFIAWPRMSEANKKRFDDMVHDLDEVEKMRGVFGVNQDAIDLYSEEYENFIKTSPFFEDPNMSGYAGRRHITVVKLSMIISAGESDERIVTIENMAQAIKFLREAETYMPKILRSINSEQCGDICEEVIRFIESKNYVDRSDLCRRFKHKLNLKELDAIIEMLTEERALEISTVKGGIIRYKCLIDLKGT